MTWRSTPANQSPGNPTVDLAPTGDGADVASRGRTPTSQSPGRPKIDLAPSGGGSGFASRGRSHSPDWDAVWRSGALAHPAFAPMAAWLARLTQPAWPPTSQLSVFAEAQGLKNAHGRPLRFAAQLAPRGQHSYEHSILESGEIPTREHNWHDLFNALCWLTYPHTKRALNAAQCASLSPGARSRAPASNAATLFDESGLILAGPDASLADALRAHRWQHALAERRDDWRAVRCLGIGHAVLEKLLTPWPGITAKCLFIETPPGEALSVADIDHRVAEHWRAGLIGSPADLFPLPVLGIPGWSPDNANPAFYLDTTVFRPARAHTTG